MRSLAMLGVEVVLLADYWRPDCDERTDIGWLVHRAKDQNDPEAASELADRFAGLAEAVAEPVEREVDKHVGVHRFAGLAEAVAETLGGSDRLVVPVPPTLPVAATTGGRLVDALARSLVAAGAGEYRGDLVVRTAVTPRLRHVDPQRRAEIAAAAGYRASDQAAGRHIVVVDDVILTGTTVSAVAACLRDAGAASVTAAVAARTRLR